jgi:glyoxylase-like metal-dependent hydrolase (beta-lactamase superfamily II)
LIDAGTPRVRDALVQELAGIGASLEAIEAVLSTHAHRDHTGVAERTRTEAGTRVWVEKDDGHALTTGDLPKNDGKLSSYPSALPSPT